MSAACVAGCIQLVAGINVPRSTAAAAAAAAAGGTAPGKPAGALSNMAAVLEEQVRISLQALNPDAPVPEFKVNVLSACNSAGSSSPSEVCSTGGTKSAADDGLGKGYAARASCTDGNVSGQLLSCSPPCLAASAGTTELQLLVEVSKPSANAPCNTGSAHGSTAGAGDASVQGRLLVWDANRVVLVDVRQAFTPGANVFK